MQQLASLSRAGEYGFLCPRRASRGLFNFADPNSIQSRSKLDPKSTQRRPNVNPKSTQRRAKGDPKSIHRRPKVDPTSTQCRPSVDPMSTQCRPKVNPTSSQTRSSVDPKSTQRRSKVNPKSIQSRAKVDPTSSQSRANLEPKPIQSRANVDAKSTQSRPKIDPKSTPKSIQCRTKVPSLTKQLRAMASHCLSMLRQTWYSSGFSAPFQSCQALQKCEGGTLRLWYALASCQRDHVLISSVVRSFMSSSCFLLRVKCLIAFSVEQISPHFTHLTCFSFWYSKNSRSRSPPFHAPAIFDSICGRRS